MKNLAAQDCNGNAGATAVQAAGGSALPAYK
jgi:hypothetical protein